MQRIHYRKPQQTMLNPSVFVREAEDGDFKAAAYSIRINGQEVVRVAADKQSNPIVSVYEELVPGIQSVTIHPMGAEIALDECTTCRQP